MDTERIENKRPETEGPNLGKVDNNTTSAEEPKKEDRHLNGLVANCQKLYVRKRPEPTAVPVGVIDEGTKVTIDSRRSTEDFYRVTVENGVYGYCMKQFIEVEE